MDGWMEGLVSKQAWSVHLKHFDDLSQLLIPLESLLQWGIDKNDPVIIVLNQTSGSWFKTWRNNPTVRESSSVRDLTDISHQMVKKSIETVSALLRILPLYPLLCIQATITVAITQCGQVLGHYDVLKQKKIVPAASLRKKLNAKARAHTALLTGISLTFSKDYRLSYSPVSFWWKVQIAERSPRYFSSGHIIASNIRDYNSERVVK